MGKKKPEPPDEMVVIADKLTDKATSHAEWLSIVRFGLDTLLENQEIITVIIMREVEREIKRKTNDKVDITELWRLQAKEFNTILGELWVRYEHP